MTTQTSTRPGKIQSFERLQTVTSGLHKQLEGLPALITAAVDAKHAWLEAHCPVIEAWYFDSEGYGYPHYDFYVVSDDEEFLARVAQVDFDTKADGTVQRSFLGKCQDLLKEPADVQLEGADNWQMEKDPQFFF